MSVELSPAKVRIEDFASTFRDQWISLNPQFSYFCSPAMADDDLRQYLQDPIAALPPKLGAVLPARLAIMLVPFLELNGPKNGVRISFDRVPEAKQAPAHRLVRPAEAVLFFAVKEEEVSDYHYGLFNELAGLVSRGWNNDLRDRFGTLLQGELAARVHGEVDEKSWRLKQTLLRKTSLKDAKAFREYARQAFEDTLTLYLHGICCDIDVETGPRQLPSRYVRKRLEFLHAQFPPPAGHAVFPEELKRL